MNLYDNTPVARAFSTVPAIGSFDDSAALASTNRFISIRPWGNGPDKWQKWNEKTLSDAYFDNYAWSQKDRFLKKNGQFFREGSCHPTSKSEKKNRSTSASFSLLLSTTHLLASLTPLSLSDPLPLILSDEEYLNR